jgi:translation elongation factor P/translation initiation factor 5A
MLNMKKKLILWLCKTWKVDLVEPINQETRISYTYKMKNPILIEDVATFSRHSVPSHMFDDCMAQIKTEMTLRMIKHLVDRDIITFDMVEQPTINGDIKFRCSFYAAKSHEQF